MLSFHINVINLPWTYEKLHCKEEPCRLERSYGTHRQTYNLLLLYKDIYVYLSGIQVIMNESFNDGWQLRLDQEVAGGLEPVNQGSNGGTHLKLFIHIING